MKMTSKKMTRNEDDLKKNENEDDLKKINKKKIGCDIIVN